MPYPNEHSCRLRSPGDFKDGSFRRSSRKHDGKKYDVIMGRLKGEDTMTEQAYRYPTKSWGESEARSHCKEHNGRFEAAESKGKSLGGDVEYRAYPVEELRTDADEDKKPVVSGVGIPFNRWSEDLGGFKEQIHPDAFRESLEKDDIRAVFNHNNDFVLGRVSAGTLRLSVTKRGVEYEVDPPGTSWANDMLVSIDRRDIRENSFSMVVSEEDWDQSGKILKRTVRKARLLELGPQTFPAYSQSSVQVRSILERGRAAVSEHAAELDLARRRLELDTVGLAGETQGR